MKRLAFLLIFCVWGCIQENYGDSNIFPMAERVEDSVITEDYLRKELSFIADSGVMLGRGTGQLGYEIARNYLDLTLRRLGYEVTIQQFPVGQDIRIDGTLGDTIYSWNVIGRLHGRILDSTAVLFGAHVDHLGMIGTTVYPGADDNASGVAAVLAIARAFSALRDSGVVLERSIVICFFGGEELLGMEGSRYFISSDYIPAHKVITFLNFDMVGRGGADSLAVMGTRHGRSFSADSPMLFDMVMRLNREGLVIVNRGVLDSVARRFTQSFGRSDNWNFFIKEIPVLFFFTGLHGDYHTPLDIAERIDYGKLRRISRLGFRVGLELIMGTMRPRLLLDSVYVDLR